MNGRIRIVALVAAALVLAVALIASRGPGRSGPAASATAVDAAGAGGSARSALLAELYDKRTRWAGAEGAFTFVGGDRTTVFVTWNIGDPRGLAALETGVDWMRAYQTGGVRVVGIAVPHYAWEADSAAVEQELNRRGMWLPVILDPDLRVSRALGISEPPPRFVLMGPEGTVTLRPGEAREVVAELERMVLGLAARGPGRAKLARPANSTSRVSPRAIELGSSFSPREFPSGTVADRDSERWVARPAGLWTLAADGLVAGRGGAERFVALRYHGVPLGAVMRPPANGSALVWLQRDGRWLEPAEAADDVRFDERGASYVEVDAPRLYALCRDDGGEHRVTLSPDAGVTICGFRFEAVPAVTPSP